MRDEKDRLPAPLELRELVEAFVGEAFIPDCEHFVHQQHVGIDVDGHRKSQTHVHPGRVRFHRGIDEFLELGELDDLVEAARDFLLGQAEHDPVDEDVLAAGDFGVKAGAELDERRDAAVDLDRTRRGLRDSGHQLEHRALAGAVAADHAERPPCGQGEGDVLHRRERLVRLQIPNQAPRQQRALERGELPPPVVAPVDLRWRASLRWRSSDAASSCQLRSFSAAARAPPPRPLGASLRSRLVSRDSPLSAKALASSLSSLSCLAAFVTLPPRTCLATGRTRSIRTGRRRSKSHRAEAAISGVRPVPRKNRIS